MDVTVVVGLGHGYLLEALSADHPDLHGTLYYLEPVPAISSALRSSGRWSQLEVLCPGKCFDDEDALRAELAAAGHATVPFFINPVYRRLFPELERELSAAGPGSGGATQVNRSTASHFFLRWGWNFARRIATPGTLNYLQRLETDRRMLYTGAGPGLAEDLAPLLHQAGRRPTDQPSGLPGWSIIAADTALAPLLGLGIAPDLVVSVDSGPGTEYHFRAARQLIQRGRLPVPVPFTWPVLTWSAGPSCLEVFFQRRFYYRSSLPFDQILGAGPLAEIPDWVNPARNPLGLVVLLAQASGHTRIFTAGADFRSAGGVSHANGTGYTLYGILRQARLSPLSSYRPGGYGPELTAKNRATMDGLQSLALDHNVQLLPLADAALDSASEPNANDPPAEPRILGVDTAVLRAYLLEHWSRLPFGTIAEEIGMPVEFLQRAGEKWFDILKNGGQGFP